MCLSFASLQVIEPTIQITTKDQFLNGDSIAVVSLDEDILRDRCCPTVTFGRIKRSERKAVTEA